ISLGEFLEQLCLLLCGHADAGIGDSELDEAAAVAHLACRKLDLARFGELARIAEEVEQDLPQPHGVHGEHAQVLLSVNGEAPQDQLVPFHPGQSSTVGWAWQALGLPQIQPAAEGPASPWVRPELF